MPAELPLFWLVWLVWLQVVLGAGTGVGSGIVVPFRVSVGEALQLLFSDVVVEGLSCVGTVVWRWWWSWGFDFEASLHRR